MSRAEQQHRVRQPLRCGWEVTGLEDVVVDATIDHAKGIHNMTATREHVLAAFRAPDAAAPEVTAE